MSSSTDGRWRAPNAQHQQQQQGNRRDRSSISGPPPSSSPRPRNNPDTTPKSGTPAAASPAPGQVPNAWSTAASADKGRNASAARTAGSAGTGAGAATVPAATGGSMGAGGLADAYAPVGDFNREEVKEFLNKRYQEAVSGDTEQISRWKAPSEAGGAAKQGSPWAQRPSAMSNGSDFWVHLKKQITAKEQGMGG